MSKDHVPFSDLEHADRVDHRHLETCKQCRQDWKIFRFFRFQISLASRLEPPPFFAKKITQAIQEPPLSFLVLLQHLIRPLVPILSVLILANTFLLLRIIRPGGNGYSGLLFEELQPEIISVGFVVQSLRDFPEEDTSFDRPN